MMSPPHHRAHADQVCSDVRMHAQSRCVSIVLIMHRHQGIGEGEQVQDVHLTASAQVLGSTSLAHVHAGSPVLRCCSSLQASCLPRRTTPS